MTSQGQLAAAFARGETDGDASSIEIRETEGGHAIVDTRGREAVLAFRYPSGGVVAFEGWYGHSPSTSSMLTKMGLSPTARHDDDREYIANATSADAPVDRDWVGRAGDCTLADWLDSHDPTMIGAPNPEA